MNPERWQEVKELFHHVSELPREQRQSYLAAISTRDPALRSELESLLAADEEEELDGFLETPPLPLNASSLKAVQEDARATRKSGQSVGPYYLAELLGVGGMGEVYRAKDERLGRTVAIKLLAPHLADQAEFRQRLEREAKALSQLNHPHICALYDIGHQDGADYLVMEYLDGETLDARLKRGPLPPADALRLAITIAQALEHAHRQGLIHRDLKPGNIMLTPTAAKLLDFGLAKPTPGWTNGRGLPQTTLTSHGVVMGTFHYMAPEQLEGKDADTRTDIFAFGAVLYEMLTGRKAFPGQSPASVIAAVMEQDPEPLTQSQPAVPAALAHVVERCVAKRPEDRWQSTVDLVAELTWIASPAGAERPRKRRLRQARTYWLTRVGAAVTLVGMGWGAAWLFSRPTAPAMPSAMVQVLPPDHTSFVFTGQYAGSLAVSPDGLQIAFVARGHGGKNVLWVRPLDSLNAVALAGTEDADWPFWSPDSRSLGFFSGSQLKRVDLGGGVPRTLCPALTGRGGAWGQDGTILFAPTVNSGLFRVAATGGTPTQVTQLGGKRQESSHRWPCLLPDGQHFLYFATAATAEDTGTYVGSLTGGGEPRLVLRGDTAAVYAVPGYLLYPREGALLAQRFDVRHQAVSGEPLKVVDQLAMNVAVQRGVFSVSDTALLAFQRGSLTQGGTTLIWTDRSGKPLQTVGERALQLWPQLSPDQQRIALAMFDPESGNEDVWVEDVQRGVRTRLTFDRSNEWAPIWSPDGQEIAFASNRGGKFRIVTVASDGSGTPTERLVQDGEGWITSWSHDRRWLAYYARRSGADARWAIYTLEVNGQQQAPAPFLASEFIQRYPVFSPDGQWLAYQSNESGQDEVYLVRFPEGTGKIRVSADGGAQPRWRRDGRELFYLSREGHLVSVVIASGAQRLQVGNGKPLFAIASTGIPGYVYEVSGDGQRFLVETLGEQAKSEPITLLFRWPSRL